ncbi:MAG: 23S rRNA (guanosine(2251)-2'-O)-methyltransferase RlmB [Desulfobacterales bacterium]|nr:23S rRNA (guanosine(2251)-2'-O)-methyltransferase RlmB [Desulfobacterales bacterium]
MKTEVLCGIHPVGEALRAGRRRIFEIGLAPGKETPRTQALRQAAASRRVPVRVLPAGELTALAGVESHQGVAARVSAFEAEEFSALPDPRDGAAPDFILALDCIQDPHNLGAILRTALCAGVQAVLAPRDRSAPPTPAVSRISAGALEHTRFIQVTNLARSLDLLKERGLWVVGLDPGARDTLYALDGAMPLVLVVGGEERGLRPLVRRSCDRLVAIPQAGPLDSLNASVAAAVVLFEIVRQRRARGRPPGEAGG